MAKSDTEIKARIELRNFLKSNGMTNFNGKNTIEKYALYCRIKGKAVPVFNNHKALSRKIIIDLLYNGVAPANINELAASVKSKKQLRRIKSVENRRKIKESEGKKKTKKISRKKDEYRKYLDSAEWKLLRNSILKERGCVCEKCKVTNNRWNLHIHHMTYKRLFNELKADLLVLCATCHKEVHKMPRKNNPYFIKD